MFVYIWFLYSPYYIALWSFVEKLTKLIEQTFNRDDSLDFFASEWLVWTGCGYINGVSQRGLIVLLLQADCRMISQTVEWYP